MELSHKINYPKNFTEKAYVYNVQQKNPVSALAAETDAFQRVERTLTRGVVTDLG